MITLTRQFQQRLLISTLCIIGIFIAIYFSFSPAFKPVYIILIAAIVSVALHEYYHLCKLKEFQPLVVLSIACAIAYFIALPFSFHHVTLSGIPSLILLVSFLLFFLVFFRHPSSPLGNIAVTLFGFVYLVIPLSCILRITYFFPPNGAEDGRLWLAYVLIVSKMTDVGGYFIGKCLGKTKLAPLLSPKKTVEGSIGGSATALLTSILFALIIPLWQTHGAFNMTLWQSIWLGLCISILAQLGDLSESLLKRDAGVKDSSHLPGLGGILDVVDSLVFTLPLLYLMLQMRLIG